MFTLSYLLDLSTLFMSFSSLQYMILSRKSQRYLLSCKGRLSDKMAKAEKPSYCLIMIGVSSCTSAAHNSYSRKLIHDKSSFQTRTNIDRKCPDLALRTICTTAVSRNCLYRTDKNLKKIYFSFILSHCSGYIRNSLAKAIIIVYYLPYVRYK